MKGLEYETTKGTNQLIHFLRIIFNRLNMIFFVETKCFFLAKSPLFIKHGLMSKYDPCKRQPVRFCLLYSPDVVFNQ